LTRRYTLPAGKVTLFGTFPDCGLEEVIKMVVWVSGMYGAPDVVFLNSRTRAEYVPPSAGRTGGLAVKVRLTLLGESAADCFVTSGLLGAKIPNVKRNKVKTVKNTRYFDTLYDRNPTL